MKWQLIRSQTGYTIRINTTPVSWVVGFCSNSVPFRVAFKKAAQIVNNSFPIVEQK